MITHEQAAQLRMIPVFEPIRSWPSAGNFTWASDADFIEDGWRTDETPVWRLSKQGEQALAEYDAETERLFDIVKQYASHSCHSLRALNGLRQHVAGLDSDWSKGSMQGSWIETSELERLQTLERNIEASE